MPSSSPRPGTGWTWSSPSPEESIGRNRRLELPAGSAVEGLDTCLLTWSLPLTREELIGLAGTYSSVITMAEEERVTEAIRIGERLASIPDLADRPMVDLPMSTRCWRAVRR
jgi:hypothetical protein